MKTYKSKFGYEVVVFLTLVLGTVIAVMLYKKEPLEAIRSVSGVFSLVYVFCFYLNFTTEYIITNDGFLKIKCGIFYRKFFDIDKIKSVKKSNNLMSAPAPSLDRIELAYGTFNLIIISPKDKEGFVKELVKQNHNIVNKLVD